MPTLSEYFEAEARDMLALLDQGLEGAPVPDVAELHRAARAVRGAAQMAREDRAYRAAGALEIALRGVLANQLGWSAAVAGHVRATLEALHSLVAGGEEQDLDDVAAAVVRRWSEAGVPLPPHIVGGEHEQETGPASRQEFREFAAREVAGIADALDSGVQELGADPMNREPLRTVLRRQRALLGSARLDELPVVAEILRAIEDLTRVIAKLDVGVKREWLDIYRVARDALRSAVGPLERNEDPQPTHALSRLRHMREELLERYGAGEAVSAAHESAGLVQAKPQAHTDSVAATDAGSQESADEAELVLLEEAQVVEPGAAEEPADDTAQVVPVEVLMYDRESALRRVLELRETIQAALPDDPETRAAADELFDLVQIALG